MDIGRHAGGILSRSRAREDRCLTQHRVGFREGKKGPYTSSALFTTRGDDKRCAFCLGTHSPEDCKKVTNIAERKKLLIKLVNVSIVLTRVTAPEIVRLPLNVRIVRALTTHVCVTRNCNNPQGGIAINHQRLTPQVVCLWVQKVESPSRPLKR